MICDFSCSVQNSWLGNLDFPLRRLKFENNWSGQKQITTFYRFDPCPEHPDFLQAPTVMSSVSPKSNASVLVALDPPVSSQPSQGS